MKKPNLPIIILCLAICVSGIAALSLKTFHTVNSTTSPYLLYLKVLQGNQQFYNVESGDYLDIHQLKETITSDKLHLCSIIIPCYTVALLWIYRNV